MDAYESILDYIRINGPSVPMELAHHIKKESIFASAMLSELVSKGKLKISHLMVGRSKLYLIPGQEDQLERFADHLNEKDKRSYDLLKEQKVIRDRGQETLVRVSLRNIRDFAVPLEVSFGTEKELFWKWYLCTNHEAESLIKHIMGYKSPDAQPDEDLKTDSLRQKEDLEKYKDKETKQDSLEENKTKEHQIKEHQIKEQASEPAGSKDKQEGTKALESESYEGELSKKPKERIQEVQESSGSLTKEETKLRQEQKGMAKNSDRSSGTQRRLQGESEPGDIAMTPIDDEFSKKVKAYFEAHDVAILGFEIIRKNSDMDLDIELSTSVGKLRYYCKARKKKTINDGDIASAYVTGQLKKLPILFLTDGKLTKKAEEKAYKELPSVTICYL